MKHAEPLIVVLGHAALDSVYRIAQFPAQPAKVRALEHIESGGGSAANAAATIARLRGNVEFWSRTGGDDAGKRILAALKADGLNTQFVAVHDHARSSHAAVIVDGSGERFIVSERDHAMPSDINGLPLSHISGASAVLSDLSWYEGTQTAFTEARRVDVATLLDIDVGGAQGAERFLPLTDYAIFSSLGLDAFAGELPRDDQLSIVLSAGARYAGVTLGKDGYLWRARTGDHGFQPAFDVPVIDTTGAGDAFHGAFAWAHAHGCKHEECALIASAVAALSVGKLGARRGLPSRDELDAFLSAHGVECPVLST